MPAQETQSALEGDLKEEDALSITLQSLPKSDEKTATSFAANSR